MEIDYLYRKRFTITFEQRKKSSYMGRFGGGWNWELGFQICSDNLIINLLVMSIKVSWKEVTNDKS